MRTPKVGEESRKTGRKPLGNRVDPPSRRQKPQEQRRQHRVADRAESLVRGQTIGNRASIASIAINGRQSRQQVADHVATTDAGSKADASRGTCRTVSRGTGEQWSKSEQRRAIASAGRRVDRRSRCRTRGQDGGGVELGIRRVGRARGRRTGGKSDDPRSFAAFFVDFCRNSAMHPESRAGNVPRRSQIGTKRRWEGGGGPHRSPRIEPAEGGPPVRVP